KNVYSGKLRDEVYLPEGTAIHVTEMPQSIRPPAKNKKEQIARGEDVFKTNCMACHQSNGQGIPAAFPRLAKSDYLTKSDKAQIIKAVTGGLQGKVIVNGQEFNGVMPAWTLSDEDIANVLTFVYNSWGNSGKTVSPQEVKSHRVNAGAPAAH